MGIRRSKRASQFSKDVRQIRSNLKNCRHTELSERALFGQSIAITIQATLGTRNEDIRLRAVSAALRESARNNALFLRGPVADLAGKRILHSKAVDRFRAGIHRHLSALFDYESARTLTEELLVQMTTAPPWRILTELSIADLPLHEHGTPFWVADATTAVPAVDVDPSLFPARAGLRPETGTYVLLQLSARSGNSPRFADSQGYPYWRPGGMTKPIAACPRGLSGLGEFVVDGMSLSSIAEPIQTFSRIV